MTRLPNKILEEAQKVMRQVEATAPHRGGGLLIPDYMKGDATLSRELYELKLRVEKLEAQMKRGKKRRNKNAL